MLSEKDVIEAMGWSIDCQSPLEISHKDGSIATMQAATMVIYSLVEEYKLEMDEKIISDFNDLNN